MPIDLDLLMHAYANGIFPMADARDDPETFWVEPKTRAILPLESLQVSRSLAKVIRQDRFTVTADTAFEEVINLCAEPYLDRPDTWINPDIHDAFVALNRIGHSHSVECWQDGKLVGGLYGLALGKAFFGESMFSRATDASKVALVWLVARLKLGGFKLLDCQFMTDHLASLGVTEVSQQDYLQMLRAALLVAPDNDQVGAGSAVTACVSAAWGTLDGLLAGGFVASDEGFFSTASSSPGKLILHSLTQTSNTGC